MDFLKENLKISQAFLTGLLKKYENFINSNGNASPKMCTEIQELTNGLFVNALKLEYGDKIGFSTDSLQPMAAEDLPNWEDNMLCVIFEIDPRLATTEILEVSQKLHLWALFGKVNNILAKNGMKETIKMAFECKLEYLLCSLVEYNPETLDAKFLVTAAEHKMENVCKKCFEVMESEDFLKYNKNRDLATYITAIKTLQKKGKNTELLEKCAKENQSFSKKLSTRNTSTMNLV